MSEHETRGPGRLGRWLWDWLASYGLACSLLVILAVLTTLGTLHQVDHGLYAAEQRFFHSWFLWAQLGDLSLPVFPGGQLAMTILAANMLVGGLIRLRIGRRNLGVAVVHLGIAALFGSALVTHRTADDGHVTLYEGQQSDEFESYKDWEVAIWEVAEGQDVTELFIPQAQLEDLRGERRRTFSSPELPFQLALWNYVPNCDVLPKGPNWESEGEPVDGFGILRKPLDQKAERNIAGLQVEAVGGGESSRGILWGMQRLPWIVRADGRHFAVEMRHRRYKMPFTIRLEDFVKEDYPGMNKARSFHSDVTRIEGSQKEIIRIEMNQPLRDSGLVLFQASWGPENARPGDPLFSTLAVWRNRADRWPEYSLWVITLGMLLVFSRKLRLFVSAEPNRRAATEAES